jgi:hypothetical protein
MAVKDIAVKKYGVRLSAQEREQLQALVRKGKGPARRLLKARDSSVAQPLKIMKTRACVIDFLSCISYTGTSYPDLVSS